MRGPRGRVAIVNDQPMSVGDSGDGFKVISISDFAVEVDIDGQRHSLGVSTPAASPPPRAAEADEDEAPRPAARKSAQSDDPPKDEPAKNPPRKPTRKSTR